MTSYLVLSRGRIGCSENGILVGGEHNRTLRWCEYYQVRVWFEMSSGLTDLRTLWPEAAVCQDKWCRGIQVALADV